MAQNYYQKEIETMSREEMKALQSEKLVKQADNYTHLGEIEAEYEAAKSRIGATVQE